MDGRETVDHHVTTVVLTGGWGVSTPEDDKIEPGLRLWPLGIAAFVVLAIVVKIFWPH